MTTSGYRIVRDVFAPRETDDLLHAIDALDLNRGRAGARHLMTHPIVRDAAHDPRMLHFDDSGDDNGPLRVLPGTHAHGVLSESAVDRFVRDVQPISCLVTRGGVIAMRPLLLHASSKAETDRPRRVLHIEYADSLELPDGVRITLA